MCRTAACMDMINPVPSSPPDGDEETAQWNRDLMSELLSSQFSQRTIPSAYGWRPGLESNRPIQNRLRQREQSCPNSARSHKMGRRRQIQHQTNIFLSLLKQLLWDSEQIWENRVCGIIVEHTDDIVAKVIMDSDNGDYTEYMSMKYLEEHAPGIPAPRPHGLIYFKPFCVMFMTDIPPKALMEIWPSLRHEEKMSMQQQLDDIFRRLRTIRQEDGYPLGGVTVEGVKEYRLSEEAQKMIVIKTAAEFNVLQFSTSNHGSNTHVKFLRLGEIGRANHLAHPARPVKAAAIGCGQVRKE
ncbi:hypothetical protein EMPG_12023 [Blastomyces silverae]|uniref:Uncharacterized protein n=1 Tax=Blastomyces silverae TaxID=2060906 RepID=A0A0H1BVB9_9EURO|nr:hypothetical protein EMPG_12023 [Blastomyces silverae]